jgi:hypothetical protein
MLSVNIRKALKHEQGLPRTRHSHRVRILEGSMLGQLAGSDSAPVNSHHHQALETVGRELVATAWAPDGLIEAAEDPSGRSLGSGRPVASGTGLGTGFVVAVTVQPIYRGSEKVCFFDSGTSSGVRYCLISASIPKEPGYFKVANRQFETKRQGRARYGRLARNWAGAAVECFAKLGANVVR